MDMFELGRMLHGAAGTLALASFWTAALAAKGGETHRRAGRLYLKALLTVMALSTLMVAGRLQGGNFGGALYIVFLLSLVGTASWLMWFSVRRRREPEQLSGPTYRCLASWLVLAGAVAFQHGLAIRRPLTLFLSLLGIGFGANMWRLALSRERGPRWWLGQHMNGAALNFVATHDSFLALGVGSVVPELRLGLPRMLIAIGLTLVALALRARLGRRH